MERLYLRSCALMVFPRAPFIATYRHQSLSGTIQKLLLNCQIAFTEVSNFEFWFLKGSPFMLQASAQLTFGEEFQVAPLTMLLYDDEDDRRRSIYAEVGISMYHYGLIRLTLPADKLLKEPERVILLYSPKSDRILIAVLNANQDPRMKHYSQPVYRNSSIGNERIICAQKFLTHWGITPTRSTFYHGTLNDEGNLIISLRGHGITVARMV